MIKKSSTYKLIVPEKVEEKIRYLLRKFPQTEWSGVLFITHEGSFEDGNLVITCQDIYPMDLGNSTFTQFRMNEDVAAYVADNIELFDCDMAIAHSHHMMKTTPSGTDIQTLREEGNERNCFVSLIVNNEGTYYAAITRKVQTKSEVTIKNLGKSYEFFGDGSREICHDSTETTQVVDKEVIEYFDLVVERHEVPNSLSYLDTRFEEIAKRKSPKPYNPRIPSFGNASLDGIKLDDEPDFFSVLHQERQREALMEATRNTSSTSSTSRKSNKTGKPNSKKVYKAVASIITCSLNINADKIDLKHWVDTHMVKVYERLFGEGDCGWEAFNQWKEFAIQFIIDYFDDPNIPDDVDDNYYSIVAEAILDEFDKYKGNNAYIDAYIETLENNYLAW